MFAPKAAKRPSTATVSPAGNPTPGRSTLAGGQYPYRSEHVDPRWQPTTPGRSLGGAVSSRYGSLLGCDLSRIQIHHDPGRAGAAGAAAYSIGEHIVAASDPVPLTTLGHELAHVAQWRTHGIAAENAEGRYRAERNAERIGADLAAGRRPSESPARPGAALQRDPLPESLGEVALESQISSILARPVAAGDDARALRRVDDLIEALARLNAHDSALLRSRLTSKHDPLAIQFRERLATATRARILAQLLQQSTPGGKAPAAGTDAAYFAGLRLEVPTRPILVDAAHHPDENVTIPVRTTVAQPKDHEFVADWTVERVDPAGQVSVLHHFELPWMSGMTITPQYTVSATDAGAHHVTVRFRDDTGAVVHIARGSYSVNTAVPQTLAELTGHPQYVDSFMSLNYDPDFRPDKPGALSYWVGVESSAGWAYVDTRDVRTSGSTAGGFHWRDGRIFPGEMNPTTTPELVKARRGVERWMDDYNTLFIIGAFIYGVFPILMMVPARVGPMPSGGTRSTGVGGGRGGPPGRGSPAPGGTKTDPVPDPVPPARTTDPAPGPAPGRPAQGPARTQTAPPEPAPAAPAPATGRLPVPPTPNNMGTNAFGTRVMRWGIGDAAARARISTLTRTELEQAGVTRSMAEQWRAFYRNEILRNPANPSAAGRADLMQRAVELLQ